MWWGIDVAIVGFALLGHFGLGLTYANYVHNLRTTRQRVALLTRLGQLLFLVIWGAVGLYFQRHGFGILSRPSGDAIPPALAALLLLCVPVGMGPVSWSLYRRLRPVRCMQLRSTARTSYDLVERLGRHPITPGLLARLARLPGNQVFELDVAEKEIVLPRLPESLDGLSIAHLSDLHLHDDLLEQAFYDEVIDLTNELRADLVMVTGDLIDHVSCIEPVAKLLGRLEARHGVYVIFGNHDWLIGHCAELQRALEAAGLVYVGGRWQRLAIDGEEVWLAGNEQPWIGPAAPLSDRPRRSSDGRPLSIALVHTPDQYPWARRGDFDLMLSGHTHGGQIAFPWLGPIFGAARTGVRYISGVFYEPPTVLHVSRGIAGDKPLRFNCPPEITKLTLRSPALRQERSDTADRELVAVG